MAYAPLINALIADLNAEQTATSARSNNWIQATVNGTNEVVNLYQFGNTWVGKNAAGQFVTLKKL